MILEKAYAKLYGSYNNIVAGFVDEAIADLTNGAPFKFDLSSADCKKMLASGELWDKLKFWADNDYLMGANSNEGKDTDMNPMGIAFGHAYSILDVCEVEGHKLV